MTRSFQWDLARQVERLDWLLEQLPKYADWGYNELHLHLEDSVEYPSLPGVARRDAYSHGQLKRLVQTATACGINVVPIVNLLGHTQYLIKTNEWRDLNELRAPDGSPLSHGQICPLHPRALEVAETLLRDMAPFCTANKVHVGLDESFHLGRCPRCRNEVSEIGLAAHFSRHVNRLHTLTQSLGLQMGMWADMLYFLPKAIPLLPRGITAYEWYYHAFERWPRVELFNFAEMDIATPLRRRGIQLYGCPMNGAFRHEPMPHFQDRMANILSWWKHCQRIGASGFLVSSWEPYRLAIELTTAIDAAAATLWLDPGITDPREMLARGFQRVFGKKGRAAAKVALACDRFPFSGYPRWEINQRWDTVSRREPLAPYREEERHFKRLARQASSQMLPMALQASLQFRHFLSVRDVGVRTLSSALGGGTAADQLVHRGARRARQTLRGALLSGGRAARTMWNLTRDARIAGPNALMVSADAKRLKALDRGEAVFGGRWQLCYRLWNFAPAAQMIGVEQQASDGSWNVKQSCHTIEFQTAAARPHGTFVREHAAPVEWNGDSSNAPALRFVVRGVGEVKIGNVTLTDGRQAFRPRGFSGRGWRRIGRPAPKAGFTEISSSREPISVAVAFRWPKPTAAHDTAAVRRPRN